MDETIDLRPYIDTLVRRWWIIVGAVLVSVLLAVLLYSSQSEYKATALVAVTDPAQKLQFDTRIVSTVDLDNLLLAYPEIAKSDSVLSQLLEQAKDKTNGQINDLLTLANMLEVETGSDVRLIRLIAQSEDPVLASELANEWANIFVSVVDSIYLSPGGEVEFYSDQISQTEGLLQAAEQALVDFQSGSRLSIVTNELSAFTDLQATYLAERNRLMLVLDDIRSLRDQITAGTGDTITWADQLIALTIQMQLYETKLSTTTTPQDAPMQLQLDSQGDLTTNLRQEQISLLNEMEETATASLGEIDVKLLGLESSIFGMQREKEELQHRFEQLTRDRDVAKETYMTLARKLDEVRIQSDDSTSGLRIASLAAPPLEPSRSNPIVMIMVSALVGFLLTVGFLIGTTWWKSGVRGTK